jgi:hypothetical protein
MEFATLDLTAYYTAVQGLAVNTAQVAIMNIINSGSPDLAICATDITSIIGNGQITIADLPYFISLITNVSAIVNRVIANTTDTEETIKQTTKLICSYVIINIVQASDADKLTLFTYFFNNYDEIWNLTVGAFNFVEAETTKCVSWFKQLFSKCTTAQPVAATTAAAKFSTADNLKKIRDRDLAAAIVVAAPTATLIEAKVGIDAYDLALQGANDAPENSYDVAANATVDE